MDLLGFGLPNVHKPQAHLPYQVIPNIESKSKPSIFMTMRINLYVGGKRSAVQAEEAASIVERFERESKGNEVYKVDMSCRQWKGEAIDILKPFLEKVSSTVRFLNVADVIAGLMTDEGLKVTETLAKVFESSNLTEIDLSDNAMGDRGLLRVDSLFTKSNLQRLYLSNCGLSAASMEMLKDSILADNGRIAKSLTELVLDKNMIGVDGAKVIGEFLPKCKKLEYFSYNGCRPIKDGTKYICEGLRGLTEEDSQPVLSRLDMEDCTFGSEEDDAIIPFAKLLKKCSQLSYLNIKDNDLGVDGLKLLVDALTTSRAKLTHLYLDGAGELGSDGARVLADYLQTQATSLRVLHLSYNELEDEGVCILLEPFSASRNVLEELSLQQNEIGEKGAEALVRAQLPKLKSLILEDNDEMPKKRIKAKYGAIANFGEDEDEEDEEIEANDVDALISQFSGAKL